MQYPDCNNLIDLSIENDALLPASLNDEFIGFRLSVSERQNGNIVMPDISGSNSEEPDRKSLSWHIDFLTNDGILDAEELMFFNRGVRKTELQEKSKRKSVVSRSCSMARVPTKRIATSESVEVNKKPRSWLSSASVRSSFVSSSPSSSGSMKNILKSSISFLKKKVSIGNKDLRASASSSSTSSTNSKANSSRFAHCCRKSMPKLPSNSEHRLSALSPSTPPHKKSARVYADGSNVSAQSMSFTFSSTTPTKQAVFRTPNSKPSGLRLPSARFGFFDLEQSSSSSKWDETFYTAPKSTPQETMLLSSASTKKPRGAELSPVSYRLTPHSNDKENKCSVEAKVDELSKHFISIDLDIDIASDLQVKKVPTDHSLTPPLKRAVFAQRTPLATHNRSHYSSDSSKY